MQTAPELWIGLVELRPLDRASFGAAGAFTNLITWARSSGEFRAKAETIAAELNMFVAGVEEEESVAARLKEHSVSEEIEDMIERAESNPNAILYSTLHTYERDGA